MAWNVSPKRIGRGVEMTRRREVALWIVAVLFMLACLALGTYYCGRQLATFMKMGAVEQGEVGE